AVGRGAVEELGKFLPMQQAAVARVRRETQAHAHSARKDLAHAVKELSDPIPPRYPVRRSRDREPDAWLRAGAPARPLVSHPAAVKRETRMVTALEALVAVSTADAERQAARDLEADARERRLDRRERHRWRW